MGLAVGVSMVYQFTGYLAKNQIVLLNLSGRKCNLLNENERLEFRMST